MPLNVSLERTGTEQRIGTVFDDGGFCTFGNAEIQAVCLQTLCKVRNKQVNNAVHIRIRKGVEEHDFIQPVDKFGTEFCAQQLVQQLLGFGRYPAVLCHAAQDQIAADVARQNDDRILKVNGAALSVRNSAVVKHLEQNVQNVRMRLFNFIKQNEPIGRLGFCIPARDLKIASQTR